MTRTKPRSPELERLLDQVEQEVKAERDAEWWADEPQYPDEVLEVRIEREREWREWWTD